MYYWVVLSSVTAATNVKKERKSSTSSFPCKAKMRKFLCGMLCLLQSFAWTCEVHASNTWKMFILPFDLIVCNRLYVCLYAYSMIAGVRKICLYIKLHINTSCSPKYEREKTRIYSSSGKIWRHWNKAKTDLVETEKKTTSTSVNGDALYREVDFWKTMKPIKSEAEEMMQTNQ